MQWYLAVLKKYAVFNGRARCKEYWMFTLYNSIVIIVFFLADNLLGLYYNVAEIGMLSGLYLIGTILPSLAVTVRRLHDISRSGWWVLLGLIPFFGTILILVNMATVGDKSPNSYGADPKAEIS